MPAILSHKLALHFYQKAIFITQETLKGYRI